MDMMEDDLKSSVDSTATGNEVKFSLESHCAGASLCYAQRVGIMSNKIDFEIRIRIFTRNSMPPNIN